MELQTLQERKPKPRLISYRERFHPRSATHELAELTDWCGKSNLRRRYFSSFPVEVCVEDIWLHLQSKPFSVCTIQPTGVRLGPPPASRGPISASSSLPGSPRSARPFVDYCFLPTHSCPAHERGFFRVSLVLMMHD